jgi:hypothetical protein
MKAFRPIPAILLLLMLILTSSGAIAQMQNTLYFMPGVPQSNRINPATNAGNGFYLGFPALAPLRLQVTSSSLAYNDIFYYNESIDSLLTFAHPDIEDAFLDAFLGNLRQDNYFGTDVSLSLASMGFRAGKNFFAVDVTTRIDNKVYYPGGIFNYLFDPDDTGELISLSGIGLDLTVLNEFALAWSREDFFLPNLDIGVRGKLLFGVANIDTRESTIDITATRELVNINNQMQFNVAGIVPFGLEGTVDIDGLETVPDEIDSYLNTASAKTIVRDAFSQSGLGLDLGLNYRPIPQLRVSASFVDLGFIRWKNTLQARSDFNYDFTGLEVNPFTGVDTTIVQELADSLVNGLVFTGGDPYISRLNSKLFIGASFYPIEKIGFGILSRTEFLDDQIDQQFTGSVNMTTGKFINLSLSYSYLSRSFNNIGAGLSLNVGPFNMYMISDNLVSAALWPMDARSINLWFGMNFTLGWKRGKRTQGPNDRPLIL